MGLSYYILMVLWAVCCEAASTTVLPPWIIDDCLLPSWPGDHPVSIYRPLWLNLRKQAKLSSVFWLAFYGVAHNMKDCNLRAGVLYQVSKVTDESFTFSEHQQESGGDDDVPSACKHHFMVLSNGSYGFISCTENRVKATEAAWKWWNTVPVSYITIISISVGVAMGVVLLVGVGAWVAWRRHSRGKALLG